MAAERKSRPRSCSRGVVAQHGLERRTTAWDSQRPRCLYGTLCRLRECNRVLSRQCRCTRDGHALGRDTLDGRALRMLCETFHRHHVDGLPIEASSRRRCHAPTLLPSTFVVCASCSLRYHNIERYSLNEVDSFAGAETFTGVDARTGET